MVNVARGACEDLNAEIPANEDELIIDRSGLRSAASHILHKYVAASWPHPYIHHVHGDI